MFFTNHDLSIYYEQYGTGNKKVIILPGWGDQRKTYNYMIESLTDIATIYIFDYPGFGNSPFPNKSLTIYDYTLLIKDFIEHENIEDPILIGHSFGGRIIINLLGYYNIKNNKNILIDAAGILPRFNIKNKLRNKFYKLLKSFSLMLSKSKKKIYLNYLFDKFASSDYKELSNNMRETFTNIVKENLEPYLKNISDEREVLIIWGDKDKVTPLYQGKRMNKYIRNSALIKIKNSGHFPYLDYPSYINKIIYTYIKDES